MKPFAGQIREKTSSELTLLWIVGVVWLVISFPASVTVARDGDAWMWGLAIAFTLPGIVAMGVGVYLSWAHSRHKRSLFDSPMLPMYCGGVVAGTIRPAQKFAYKNPIHLRLRCIFGANEQTKLVWQNDLLLDQFDAGTEIKEIPVYFRIPPTEPPISTSCKWELVAQSKTQQGWGGHFSATFELPVRAGPPPQEVFDLPDETVKCRKPAESQSDLMSRHIQLSPLPGGFRVDMSPRRNLILGSAFAGMGMLFLAVAATLLCWLDVACDNGPRWLIPILFGAFGAVAVWLGMRWLLLRTTIIVQDRVISIENRIGLGSRRRKIHGADITDITTEIEGSLQDRLIYKIKAKRIKGRSVRICGMIYDLHDAEWLANEMKKAVQIRFVQ
ncbi:MAG: phage holin family protein [Phycisphaerales bacterium]|nr:phage holin family protein [Phycisphaerales bacterium]